MKRKVGKYLSTKEHREWSLKIRARDEFQCVVCGSKEHLNAHHLIPKEIIEFRSNMKNGITLCAKHHTRYGNGLSPHSYGGNMLFYFWMSINRPKQLAWIEDNYDI